MSKVEEKQVTLNDYLRILIRRKWLILLTFLCFTGSAVAFSLLTTPIYQACTTILIEKEGGMEDYIFSISTMMKPESKIRNQVEIIKSRTLAEAVAGSLRQFLSSIKAYETLFQRSLQIRPLEF